jgi:hypothetical protein
MREIKPYKTENGLMKAVDNGGHLYNLFSRGGDQIITEGELSKAAGAMSAGIYAYLFFDMACQDLPEEARQRAIASLEPHLRKSYEENRPLITDPSRMGEQPTLGRGVIIAGYVRPLEDVFAKKAQVNVPISAGSGTGYEKNPLVKKYDVFEMFDSERMKGGKAIAATDKGTHFPPGKKVRLGGILEKLFYVEKDPQRPRVFLDALFYTWL